MTDDNNSTDGEVLIRNCSPETAAAIRDVLVDGGVREDSIREVSNG